MYPLRLLRFLGPYKLRTLLAFLCLMASSAAVLAVPQLIGWAIDYGLGLEHHGDQYVATGEQRLLVIAAVAIMGGAVLRGLFPYGPTDFGEWISQRAGYHNRKHIYDRAPR